MKASKRRALFAAVALTAALGVGFSVQAAEYGAITASKSGTPVVNITDSNITINATNRSMYNGSEQQDGASAVDAEAGGQITLGNAQTDTIMVTATGRNPAGIMAGGKRGETGGKVTVNGKNLNITVDSNVKDAWGYTAGIQVHNNTGDNPAPENAAAITINAENTVIKAKTLLANPDSGGEYGDIGIMAYSNGQLNINGNLEVDARTAISTRGNATININQNGDKTVKLNGNIDFDSGENRPSSGGVSDATVNINLNNADSYLKGNTLLTGKASQQANKFSKYMTLRVANGASWTADGEAPAGVTANVVNNLIVDNGTVDTGKVLTVMNSLDASNNASVKADAVNIGSALPDGSKSEATADIKSGSQLTAGTLTVNSESTLNSEEGATVTADDVTIDGKANLNGTTNITNSLTTGENAEVTMTNLATAPKTTNLQGTTNYSLGNNDWNNPKTLSAKNLNVDSSNMTIDGGLRGGQTVEKVVLTNSYSNQDGSTGTTNVVGGKQNISIGTTLQGTGEAELAENQKDVLYKVDVSKAAQPQTHQATMAQDASLTTVAGGFDFLDEAAGAMTEDGVYGIASVGGGEHKYDTGSHIKTNAWHAVAGVGVKNGGSEYGAFYDYGDGHYRTFSDGRGDGKTIYKGAGLFGKYTFDNQMYVEGSFRAGHVKNDASDIFHDSLGNKYGLKLSSNYNAFHVGIGKVLDVGGDDTLDVYGKFFHTHIGSDSFEAGGHYDIDSVDSNILRVGTRWNHKAGAWTHYLGVAYEYEFDGEAKGTADGARIESADIGGSSVRFELGTKVETGKWVIGFNADAYAGQHKGYDGTISAGLKF